MNFHKKLNYKDKVVKVANDLLIQNDCVNLLDVLCRMNWLDISHIYRWKDGLEDNLESYMQSTPEKRAEVYHIFEEWSAKLPSIEAPWKFHSIITEGKKLQVLDGCQTDLELLFSRHFHSRDLSSRKKTTLHKKLTQKPDLRVFIKTGKDDDTCKKCNTTIYRKNFIYTEAHTVYCLDCAGLGQLVFLPSGDATLSRRAKKFTRKFAEVVEFNKRRKRYERRGILVEEEALEIAKRSCESDASERAVKRLKSTEKRVEEDKNFTSEFCFKVKQLFPNCPADEVNAISEHATVRGSGRVGRTAAAKKLDDESIRLAVIAYIRHKHTDYDRLLINRTPKKTCRRLIQPVLQKKLKSWEV
ncbi:MAG: DUF2293 domain-containing protein [Lentisphaerales bacterium]|nr:DUF2293 domain-containing protein [Lentisphaerales bacterium]